MARGRQTPDFFTRIDQVRKLLCTAVGSMSDQELQSAFCHCWYFQFGRRKELSPREYEILELLLKQHLSPKTVYHWFLLNHAPRHIQEKVRAKTMSLHEAISASYAWRCMRTQQGCQKLMEDIRMIMRGLVWKSHEQQQR